MEHPGSGIAHQQRDLVVIEADVAGRALGKIPQHLHPRHRIETAHGAKASKAPSCSGTPGPADVLLREREAVLAELSDETSKRFEDLFQRINKTLGK